MGKSQRYLERRPGRRLPRRVKMTSGGCCWKARSRKGRHSSTHFSDEEQNFDGRDEQQHHVSKSPWRAYDDDNLPKPIIAGQDLYVHQQVSS